MKNISIVFRSFLDAVGTFIYIFAIAWSMFNGKDIFGQTPNFFIPIFMLLLFIVSALITSSLVLGKPILLYLDGAKKQALHLLFATLAWLVFFLLSVATVLILYN